MNIEELKLILETFATVSSDAKTVAIWYFVAKYGLSLLSQIVIVGGILGAINYIVRGFMGTSEWTRHGIAVAKAWGGEGDEYSYNRDIKAIRAAIKAAPEKAPK